MKLSHFSQRRIYINECLFKTKVSTLTSSAYKCDDHDESTGEEKKSRRNGYGDGGDDDDDSDVVDYDTNDLIEDDDDDNDGDNDDDDIDCVEFLDGPVIVESKSLSHLQQPQAQTSPQASTKSSAYTQIVIDVYLIAECCYIESLLARHNHHHQHDPSKASSSLNCLLNLVDFSIDTTTTATSSSFNNNSEAATAPPAGEPSPSHHRPATYELLERWTISMITTKK